MEVGAHPRDILRRRVRVAEYYRIPPIQNATHYSHQFYNEGRDSWFTFSFDDYVITSFVSGPGSSTLPIFIFGQVKRGVTPETNAVATMMLFFTLAMLAVGQFTLGRASRKTGGSGTGGMAGMIAEQA